MTLYKCVKCKREYKEGDEGWLWNNTEYGYCSYCQKDDAQLNDKVVGMEMTVEYLCKAKEADQTSTHVVEVKAEVSKLQKTMQEKVPALEEKVEKVPALEAKVLELQANHMQEKVPALEEKVEKVQEEMQKLTMKVEKNEEDVQIGMQKLKDDIENVDVQLSLDIMTVREEAAKFNEQTAKHIAELAKFTAVTAKHGAETAKHGAETAKHGAETAKLNEQIASHMARVKEQENKEMKNKKNRGNSKANDPSSENK